MKNIITLFVILFIHFHSFSQVNLNQGLVMYLPFNGNTNDASGNGNNAINNGATLTADKWGNPNGAYYFDGSDFMTVLDDATLNPQSLTLYALVQPQGFYNGSCYVSCIYDKANADYVVGNYGLRTVLTMVPYNCLMPDTNNSNYRIDIATLVNANNNPALYNLPRVQKNQWDCVIGTYDNGVANLYVNGVLRATYNEPTIGNNGLDLFIGRKNNASYPYWFKGIMDEMRIYNRALNLQEIDSLCNFNPNAPVVTDDITANFSLAYPVNCEPKTVQFTDLSLANNSTVVGWQWNFGDGGTSNLQNPLHIYLVNGLYNVSLIATSSTNKKDTFLLALNVGASPEFATTYGDTISCGQTDVHLKCIGGVSYSWTPCTGNCNSSDYFTSINSTTQFIVEATDANGCKDIDTVYAYLTSNDESVIVPNAFSPNGDNVNDCVKVMHTVKFTDFYFAIYNRWGELVFETDNPSDCWNGQHKNKDADVGTYGYFVKASSSCGKIFKKGDITLVR